MLQKLAENLWVVERPQRFYGLESGGREAYLRASNYYRTA
jgi:hypothetical protein